MDRHTAMLAVDREVGKRLRDRRNALGMTLADLARDARLGVSQLSRYETGRCSLHLSQMAWIAMLLGYEPAELLKGLGIKSRA